MIVECNGLPGCGKTTLIKALSKELKARNIQHTIVGVEFFRNNRGGSSGIFFKIRRFMKLFRFEYLSVIRSHNKFPGASFLNAKEKLITLLYLKYIENEYSEPHRIILADEGIIQTLSTVMLFSGSETGRFDSAIGFLRNPAFLAINCNINENEAQKRFCSRNRKNSAIDILSGEELKAYYADYKKQLDKVRNMVLSAENADMSQKPEEAVKKILMRMEVEK